MGSKKVKYKKMLLNMAITLIWILLIFLLGPKLISFFMPFLIGWVISMISNPLVKFLERKLKIVRKHSSFLIIIATLSLVITGGYFLISRTVTEIFGFVAELPKMYDDLEKDIVGIGDKFANLLVLLPEELKIAFNNIWEQLSSYISNIITAIGAPTVEAAGSVARNIPNVFVVLVVTIMSAYFFITDREKILETVRSITPNSVMKQFDNVYTQIRKMISGYFAAQFKIMGIVALVLFIGFILLRVRYAILLAVLIAILDFLPFFGTGTALIPWALVEFLSGDYSLAVGLIVIYLVSQVVRQVIQPKIVGESMGLDPLSTLFFMYIGFKVKGIAGMILAVPVGVILIVLFRAGLFRPLIEGGKEIVNDINEYRKM